jgi:hypothetical protein
MPVPPEGQEHPAMFTKLLIKTALFVATEALLNSANLDTLADYSEFLQDSLTSDILRHTPAIIA